MTLYSDLDIEGFNGERAALRLRRGGILLTNLRKTSKNHILVRIRSKDVRKAFAFLENSCYNIKKVRPVGWHAALVKGRKKLPLLFGVFASCLAAIFSKGCVLKVQVTGSGSYLATQALAVLEENGVTPFRFAMEKEFPFVAAQLFSLPDVCFASLERVGYVLVVRLELSPSQPQAANDLLSPFDGVIKEIVVLSGTAEKQVGDQVTAGDLLVGAYVKREDGEKQSRIPVARVAIERQASAYGVTQKQAEEKIKLLVGEGYEGKTVSYDGEFYLVTVTYQSVVTVNLGKDGAGFLSE